MHDKSATRTGSALWPSGSAARSDWSVRRAARSPAGACRTADRPFPVAGDRAIVGLGGSLADQQLPVIWCRVRAAPGVLADGASRGRYAAGVSSRRNAPRDCTNSDNHFSSSLASRSLARRVGRQRRRNDGLIWPHCDGLKWPHLVRWSADAPVLIERGSGAGGKWDPEWNSSSRSVVIASVKTCRCGRLPSVMGCIAGRCGGRCCRRCRRRRGCLCRDRRRSSARIAS